MIIGIVLNVQISFVREVSQFYGVKFFLFGDNVAQCLGNIDLDSPVFWYPWPMKFM